MVISRVDGIQLPCIGDGSDGLQGTRRESEAPIWAGDAKIRPLIR